MGASVGTNEQGKRLWGHFYEPLPEGHVRVRFAIPCVEACDPETCDMPCLQRTAEIAAQIPWADILPPNVHPPFEGAITDDDHEPPRARGTDE